MMRNSSTVALGIATSLAFLAAVPAARADDDVISKPVSTSNGHHTDWDALFGATPAPGTWLLEGTLGFAALPKLEAEYGLNDKFSIGGAFTFDYGYYLPNAAFNIPGIYFTAPMRLKLAQQGALSAVLKGEFGLGFVFPSGGSFVLAIPLNVGVALGYAVSPTVTVGGGMDIPFAIDIATGGGRSEAIIPLLFGPMLEARVAPQIDVLLDAKFGPWLGTSSSAQFGLKLGFGVAYRL